MSFHCWHLGISHELIANHTMENNEDMLDQLRVLQRFTGGVDQLIAMDMGLGGS